MNKQLEFSNEEIEAIKALARKSLVDFSIYTNPRYEPNWHHELIAKELESIEDGSFQKDGNKILILMLPPRHGKSEESTINFPAWYLGRNPDKEIITASYSGELAQDFGYKTRNLVDSDFYKDLFQVRLRADSQSKVKWLTEEGGGYTSVGIGGAITGRGAHILVIDDPIKNREEAESELIRNKHWDWFTSTAYTRLEPGGIVILILTRWHMDDLAGRILNNEELKKRTKIVKFPALATKDEEFRKQGEPLWEKRYNFDALLNIKNTIGSYDWSALYQQEPIATEDQEFKPEFYQYRNWEDVYGLKTKRFLTIDTAISKQAESDYTGYCLNYVDQNNKWNLKAWRAKQSPTELMDNLFTLWETHRLDCIGVEKTIYLMTLKPFLDEEMRVRNKFLRIVELKHNQTQKEIRIRGLIPRYESHSIFHIKNECNDLEEEQSTFPLGIHDDVLDAEAYQVQIANAPGIERKKKIRPNYEGIKLRMTSY